MKLAIISLTKGGHSLSKKLFSFYKGDYYDGTKVFSKYPDTGSSDVKIDGNFKEIVEEAFKEFDGIIFIMATGIVVRTIAPLIKSKLSDPALIVMDEKGKNIISLLSGHLGGGNELAIEIANLLNGNPVITTSSDVNGKLAVDVFAKKNNLVIESMNDAKNLASVIVNGGKIGIVLDDNINIEDKFLEKNSNCITEISKASGILNITNKVVNKLDKEFDLPTLKLIPKNIVIGVGCRKNKEYKLIKEAILDSLKINNLSQKSIKHMATVDIKKDEIGIIECAKYFDVPLIIVDRTEIEPVENQFAKSDFVKKTIGVGAVCEPCAMLSSKKTGKFLLKKTIYDGITIAIWEEEYEIR